MSLDFFGWFLFGGLALVSGILNGVLSYAVTSYLSKHGVKVNYWNIRLYMLKYLKQYQKLTAEKNGKTGSLFYAWIISIGVFVVSAAVLIVQIFL